MNPRWNVYGQETTARRTRLELELIPQLIDARALLFMNG